jgi:two-component system chemotaxis sensor kinase CheA
MAAGDASPRRRLLLVDQSPFSQLLLRPLLAQAGYEVVVAEDPVVALGLYDAGEQFQLIMVDTSSPENARQLAATLNRAAGWHKTPLLSLAIHNTMTAGGAGGMAPSTLLDAVSGALDEFRGAA